MTLESASFNKPPFTPFGWLAGVFTVMDRYILSELVPPFVFGVGAFSSIGVAIGVLFDLVRRITDSGLPFSLAIQIFLLKLPFYIGLAFPMSMLLSCLMVYGRMSGDSELIALRSSGISVYRLVAPAIAMGLVVTGITFAFNEAIVPAANRQADATMDRALNRKEPSFRERNILYQEFRQERQPGGVSERVLSRIFYAKQFDGKRMKGLTILDFSQSGLNQIVSSESAVWNTEAKTWDFFNGTIYVVAADGSYRNIVRFEQQQIQLPRTPLNIAENKLSVEEMNLVQTRARLELISQTGEQKEIKRLTLAIEQKMAFPFSCLVFGLVGATLGSRPQRTSRATGFGISLLIILGYYLAISICQAMFQLDILSSFLAGWLPTMVGLTVGMLLLIQRNR